MSSSGELLPAKLKWIILSCFAGIITIMIISYIVSPKLVLDESAYFVDPPQPNQNQTTSSAITQHTPVASSSARLDTPNHQGSIESILEDEASLEEVAPTPSSAVAPTAAAINQPADQSSRHCDFSSDGSKKIFSLKQPSKISAYFTPIDQLYQVYLQKFGKSSKVRLTWYCTEKEAQALGLSKATEIIPLLQ